MVIRIQRDGIEVTTDDTIVEEWLQGIGGTLAALSPEQARAYAAMKHRSYPYRYPADGQPRFLAALQRYAHAMQDSEAGTAGAGREWGKGSSLDNELNRWRMDNARAAAQKASADAGEPDRPLDEKALGEYLTEADLPLYEEIRSILRHQDRVLGTLAELNALIAATDEPRRPDEWHALFLSELADHGFEQNPQPVYERMRSGDFLAATVGKGLLPLDPAADYLYFTDMNRLVKYKHGALTHTLQWLIVGRHLNRSLLPDGQRLVDAFKRTARLRPVGVQEATHLSLWTTLADLPAVKGICRDATMPEGLMYLICQYFPELARLEREIQDDYLGRLKAAGKKTYDWKPPAS